MIGNNIEPGVSSTVDSAPSVRGNSPSPGTPLLVGGANVQSEYSTNTVYAVSRSTDAQNIFGSDSHLTQNIFDALRHGAQPVLAVAPAESSVTENPDTESGTLGQPLKEDKSTVTVTVDSTDKTVVWKFGDLSGVTVPTDEVYINPATGDYKLDAAPSTSASVDYTALDYHGALNAVASYDGDVDFVAPLKEEQGVPAELQIALQEMENLEKLALGVTAVRPLATASTYTPQFDTSRLQMLTCARGEDYGSNIGAYVGLRADLGLTTTPINQRLNLRSTLLQKLDESERGSFIDDNITPLEAIGGAARVVDDLTTVTEDNTAEANLRYGFTRLVVDYLIDVVHDLETPFIGRFNSPGVIGQLEDLLNKEARVLEDSNVIYTYEAEVTLIDPTTASVKFHADVAEPIRFIENDFVIGNDLSAQNQA